MASPLATIGILSIGDMGVGIGKLLVAHNYRVVTNVTGRSTYTHSRATNASISLLPTDSALVQESDYILSIVPPRDALATAHRIATALSSTPRSQPNPLYYLDLNAISPSTTKKIASTLPLSTGKIRYIDGGIIGGPPAPKDSSSTSTPTSTLAPAHSYSTPDTSPPNTTPGSSWSRPSLPLSGPDPLTFAPISGPHLASVLNATHVSNDIGPATGLKMCFASLSKGFIALALQSYTTAHTLGVLPQLQAHLDEFTPGVRQRAERGMVGSCPKAYRWVREMEEIAETFEMGGFDGKEGGSTKGVRIGEEGEGGKSEGEEEGSDKGGDLFRNVAMLYRFLAEETELGKERIGERKRGREAEDVAVCMAEGAGRGKRVRSQE